MKLKQSEVKEPNFISDGKIFLVRCILCDRENYSISVASSQCAWCGEYYELEACDD